MTLFGIKFLISGVATDGTGKGSKKAARKIVRRLA
jgi:hypothetical protein